MMVIQNRDFTLKELGLRLVLMDGRRVVGVAESLEVSDDFTIEAPKKTAAAAVGPKKGHKNMAPKLVNFTQLLDLLRGSGVTLKYHTIRRRLGEVPNIQPRRGWYDRSLLNKALALGLFERRVAGRPRRPWRKSRVSVNIND